MTKKSSETIGYDMVCVSGVRWQNDAMLQGLSQKYHHWDRVLHNMQLLADDEHLNDALRCRAAVLVIADDVAWQEILGGWCGVGAAWVEKASKHSCLENVDDQIFNCSETWSRNLLNIPADLELQKVCIRDFEGHLVDVFWLKNRSCSEKHATFLNRLFCAVDVLVTVDCPARSLATVLLYADDEFQAPALWLDIGHSTDESEKLAHKTGMHRVSSALLLPIVDYLQALPSRLWPCLLAQRLERRVRALAFHTAPKLSRWRRFWLIAVVFLDFTIFFGFFVGLSHIPWLKSLLQLQWTTLPALLAVGSFLFLAIFAVLSVLILRQIHKGSCALCAQVLSACSPVSALKEKRHFQRAFRANVRSFMQSMTCRNLCGWDVAEQKNALSFCQYCQDLKSQLLEK